MKLGHPKGFASRALARSTGPPGCFAAKDEASYLASGGRLGIPPEVQLGAACKWGLPAEGSPVHGV